MKRLFQFMLLLTLLGAAPAANSQCAMCKQTAEASAKQQAKGLNAGIMYLLVIPYALVGGIGYWWYSQRKKSKSEI